MENIVERIVISKDFTDAPGARSTKDGDFSGEEFLMKILLPKYELVRQTEGAVLHIDFDNVEGYATSFLEAAFGGLARKYPASEILNHVRFKCEDEPMLVDEIKQYILEANKK